MIVIRRAQRLVCGWIAIASAVSVEIVSVTRRAPRPTTAIGEPEANARGSSAAYAIPLRAQETRCHAAH